MIRTLPKPLPGHYPSKPRIQRLPKRNRMTLALGMVCNDGLMLASDTRISFTGGAVSDAQKITGFPSKSGMYAIVHSSNDANAANSLIAEIRAKLEKADAKTFPVLESAIKGAMQKWYVPVHDDRPTINLLIGACIEQEQERGLYFCEPPNTVSRVWDNYRAIGDGWEVSDDIYKWFKDGSPWPSHASLCQISYMMYKAKQAHPGSVGGETDVAMLTEPLTVPYWINRVDMKVAEGHGQYVFDKAVSQMASLIMSGDSGEMKTILKTAEGIYSCGLTYSRLEFRCQFPDKTIKHDT